MATAKKKSTTKAAAETTAADAATEQTEAAAKPAAKKSDKTLATNVHVGGKVYEAGSTPPADIAKQITNPKAWA